MLIKYFSALTEIGRKHRHDERRNKSKQFALYLYHSVSHFDARTLTHNHSSVQTQIQICKWNQKVFNLLEPPLGENCCLLSGGGSSGSDGKKMVHQHRPQKLEHFRMIKGIESENAFSENHGHALLICNKIIEINWVNHTDDQLEASVWA